MEFGAVQKERFVNGAWNAVRQASQEFHLSGWCTCQNRAWACNCEMNAVSPLEIPLTEGQQGSRGGRDKPRQSRLWWLKITGGD